MKHHRQKEDLFVHFFQEKEDGGWKSEEVTALSEAEAIGKLRETPKFHDPDKMFDSVIDFKQLTMADLVRRHTHHHPPEGSLF